MDWYKEVPQLEKHLLDVVSVGTVVGAVTNSLPAIAALLTIIWTGIRVWETDTVRNLTGRKQKEPEADE